MWETCFQTVLDSKGDDVACSFHAVQWHYRFLIRTCITIGIIAFVALIGILFLHSWKGACFITFKPCKAKHFNTCINCIALLIVQEQLAELGLHGQNGMTANNDDEQDGVTHVTFMIQGPDSNFTVFKTLYIARKLESLCRFTVVSIFCVIHVFLRMMFC